jgi:hypothetical protein
MNLVFIHGRSQEGKDPTELRRSWEAALEKGMRAAGRPWPKGLEVVFPYYADVLERLVQQADSPLISNILTRGDDNVRPQEALRASLLAEMAAGRQLSDAAIRANFDGGPLPRDVQNWKWVQAILRTLDGTEAGQDLIDRVTRDVSIYLTYEGIRQTIDRMVAKEIPAGKSVVVSHSLGTLIAYNILLNAAPGVAVPLHVTLGSPLGLKNIQAHLETPLRMPAATSHWFNARDPQDVVALFPLDAQHFGITPPIEDWSKVRNHTGNQHGIEGYLDDPEVARKIWDALMAL